LSFKNGKGYNTAASYHYGTLRIPIFVRIPGIIIPATPNIAHRALLISAYTNQVLAKSFSDNLRGSKPKSPARLPSKYGGGSAPGK